MKKRIKIDSSILSAVVLGTGLLFLCKDLYPQDIHVDNILDFFGVIMILKGTLYRMSARGHKKSFSAASTALVTTGPYGLVRNPMYLGSCTMGAGFVLIAWPWWSLPIFLFMFYLRFIKQIKIEEEVLAKDFGEQYDKYCKDVPRLLPTIAGAFKAKTKDIINMDEAFSTKEVRGLTTWPILAIVLDLFQESIIYGSTNIVHTIILFGFAALVFIIGLIVFYQVK